MFVLSCCNGFQVSLNWDSFVSFMKNRVSFRSFKYRHGIHFYLFKEHKLQPQIGIVENLDSI